MEALRHEKFFAGECEFYMAELALCLRRTDVKKVASGGVSASVVKTLIGEAVQEIGLRANVADTGNQTTLRSYVASAFQEVLG
jgi:hypothetical protein